MKFHIYKSNFCFHSMDSTEHDGQEMLIQDESENSDRPSEIIASMEEKYPAAPVEMYVIITIIQIFSLLFFKIHLT